MAFIVKASTLNRPKMGAEEELIEFQPGVKFLVRGMGHRFVQIGIQANRENQQQVYSRYLAGDISALAKGQTDIEINSGVLGALVLGGWEGVTTEDGQELQYTPDVAKAIVMDPENIKLVEWLIAEATRITREMQERLESHLGKSSRDSSGKKEHAGRKSEAKTNVASEQSPSETQ